MKHDEKTFKIFENIIQQFKTIRLAKGMTHTALAKKIGMTRPAISHIENDKRKPSLLAAVRIADGLGKNLSEIVRAAERAHKKKK
ncbi:MAG: helix-turn-helix transcriptional regulator [Alphaproteobacteria bacterium]|nr:helix-turn-helix transcriptional regulator [Alphaproteobacteria bacterium]